MNVHPSLRDYGSYDGGRQIIADFGGDKPKFIEVYSGDETFYQALPNLRKLGLEVAFCDLVVNEVEPIGVGDVSLERLSRRDLDKVKMPYLGAGVLLGFSLGVLLGYLQQDLESFSQASMALNVGGGTVLGAVVGNACAGFREGLFYRSFFRSVRATDDYVRDLRRNFGPVEF